MSSDTLCKFWTECQENIPPAFNSATLDMIHSLECKTIRSVEWERLPEHPPISKEVKKKIALAITREAAKREAAAAQAKEEVSLLCDESMPPIVRWTDTNSVVV